MSKVQFFVPFSSLSIHICIMSSLLNMKRKSQLANTICFKCVTTTMASEVPLEGSDIHKS